MLRAAWRLSTSLIWVDDLLEMYDFHPLPFLTLLSCIFFSQSLLLILVKDQPCMVHNFCSVKAWCLIPECSHISSQAISRPVAHTAPETPETTLCVLGDSCMHTHTCTRTIYHKYLKTERRRPGSWWSHSLFLPVIVTKEKHYLGCIYISSDYTAILANEVLFFMKLNIEWVMWILTAIIRYYKPAFLFNSPLPCFYSLQQTQASWRKENIRCIHQLFTPEEHAGPLVSDAQHGAWQHHVNTWECRETPVQKRV